MSYKRHSCPNCSSSDGYCVYDDDNHGYCFVCGFYTKGNNMTQYISKQNTFDISKQIALDTCTQYTGKPWLAEAAASVGVFNDRENHNIVGYPYYDLDRVLTGLKFRNLSHHNPNKVHEKSSWWASGSVYTVFGLHIRTGKSNILIVEGESDTIASYTILNSCNMPFDVIGISGVNTVNKLKSLLPTLIKYTYIYIAYDNDVYGAKATEETIEMLPEYKCKIVKWSENDPCDLIEKNKGNIQPFIDCLLEAKSLQINTYSTGSDYKNDFMQYLSNPKNKGFKSDFKQFDSLLGGKLFRGECLLFVANTGTGKSTLIINWLCSVLSNNDDLKVLWLSTEFSKEMVGIKILEVLYKTELTMETLFSNIDKYRQGLEWVSDNFIFIDTLSVDELCQIAKDLIYTHSVGIVVVDVINDMTGMKDHTGTSAKLMLKFIDLVKGAIVDKREPITVILVCHTIKIENQWSNTITLSNVAGGGNYVTKATAILGMDVLDKNKRNIKIMKPPRMYTPKQQEVVMQYNTHTKRYEEL